MDTDKLIAARGNLLHPRAGEISIRRIVYWILDQNLGTVERLILALEAHRHLTEILVGQDQLKALNDFIGYEWANLAYRLNTR